MLYFFLKCTLQKWTTWITIALKDIFLFVCFLLELFIYNIYKIFYLKNKAKLDLQINNFKSLSWKEQCKSLRIFRLTMEMHRLKLTMNLGPHQQKME